MRAAIRIRWFVWQEGCRATLAMVVGSSLHLLLLLAPVFVFGDVGPLLSSPQCLAFLALATLFYLAEHSQARCRDVAAGDSAPRFCYVARATLTRWLALLTGLFLLLTFWIAVATSSTADRLAATISCIGGGLLMMGGIGLRFAAMRRLGRYFVSETAIQKGQAVIDDGIYGVVRHPSETGTLLIASGASLLLQSPAALAVFSCLLVPLVILRVKLEDSGLRAAFGPAYADYQRRVKRLLPFVF